MGGWDPRGRAYEFTSWTSPSALTYRRFSNGGKTPSYNKMWAHDGGYVIKTHSENWNETRIRASTWSRVHRVTSDYSTWRMKVSLRSLELNGDFEGPPLPTSLYGALDASIWVNVYRKKDDGSPFTRVWWTKRLSRAAVTIPGVLVDPDWLLPFDLDLGPWSASTTNRGSSLARFKSGSSIQINTEFVVHASTLGSVGATASMFLKGLSVTWSRAN